MERLASFSFVLRPFSLGLAGLCVLVGIMDSGDHEVVILLGQSNGHQESARREVSQVVSLDVVIEQAENEAKAMSQYPDLPLVWIRSQDRNAWGNEISVLKRAAFEALRTVKSPDIRDVLARAEFVDPGAVTAPVPSQTDRLVMSN